MSTHRNPPPAITWWDRAVPALQKAAKVVPPPPKRPTAVMFFAWARWSRSQALWFYIGLPIALTVAAVLVPGIAAGVTLLVLAAAAAPAVYGVRRLMWLYYVDQQAAAATAPQVALLSRMRRLFPLAAQGDEEALDELREIPYQTSLPQEYRIAIDKLKHLHGQMELARKLAPWLADVMRQLEVNLSDWEARESSRPAVLLAERRLELWQWVQKSMPEPDYLAWELLDMPMLKPDYIKQQVRLAERALALELARVMDAMDIETLDDVAQFRKLRSRILALRLVPRDWNTILLRVPDIADVYHQPDLRSARQVDQVAAVMGVDSHLRVAQPEPGPAMLRSVTLALALVYANQELERRLPGGVIRNLWAYWWSCVQVSQVLIDAYASTLSSGLPVRQLES
jgi:hypothetical protein